MWPTDWPYAVRTIAGATDDALTAARDTDTEKFHDAVEILESADPHQVASVHAEIVRSILEDLHPDGLTGEDVQAALEKTVRSAGGWLPTLEVAGFVDVLTGALGVADQEDEPRAKPRVEHALLIIGAVAGTKVVAADYVLRAVGEIARAQTIEMP